MRPVIYSLAISLDGYIARPDGAFDWIPEEPTLDWGAFMDRFDAVLVGRSTWEVTLAQPKEYWPTVPVSVFSDTMEPEDAGTATVVRRADSFETVETMRAGQGKAIWLMGGGVLFRSLLDAGLVDQVETAVAPVLLGEGLPLLTAGADCKLRLKEHRTYPSGLVNLLYDVERST